MSQRETENPVMTPFDGLLKHMADHFATELMGDLGGIEGILSCESVGGEVELVHRLTDRVWQVTQALDGSEVEFLYHLEFESRSDASMGRRLGAYGWGLYEKYKLPVRHLVWYVGDARPTGWPQDTWMQERSHQMKVGDEVLSQTRWRDIWLPGGYEARQFASEAPSYLLPFAALMKGMDQGLLGQLQSAILGAELSNERKQDLLAMLVFFACRSLQMTQVMEVIDMALLEKNNPFAQYLLEKGMQQGRQEGREEGREDTLREEAKKTRAIVVSQLSKALGTLSLVLTSALEGCESPDILRDVLILLVEEPKAPNLEELVLLKLTSDAEQSEILG